jgi:Ferritin-like domain
MTIEPVLALSRRRVLAAGGAGVAGVALAGVLAACGDDGAEDAIPQTGEPTPVQTIPESAVSDAVLLRTASSLVHSLIDAYDRVLATGVLDGAERGVVDEFRQVQDVHVEALAEATEQAGGEPYDEPNVNFTTYVIEPGFELIDAGGSDPQDLIRFLHALESVATATHQGFVPTLSDPELRQAAMAVGGVEARHATVLSTYLEGTTVLPATAVAPPDAAAEEPSTTAAAAEAGAVAAPVAQVPGAFGALTAVTVVLNGEELIINTPGPNSYVY